jgi:hypothetical protein
MHKAGVSFAREMGAFTSRGDAIFWKRRLLGGQRCRQGYSFPRSRVRIGVAVNAPPEISARSACYNRLK